MPNYTDMNAEWQAALAGPIIDITTEVVIDPYGDALILTGKEDMISMNAITSIRELDLDYYQKGEMLESIIEVADPDGQLNINNSEGRFFESIGELSADVQSGATSVTIWNRETVAFSQDQTLEIVDGETSEELTVASFSSSTYEHTINFYSSLNSSYKKGSRIYTPKVENIDVIIRLRTTTSPKWLTCFLGKLIKAPRTVNKTASLRVVFERKILFDRLLLGPDTGDNQLKYILDGSLVSSVTWNEGASGTFLGSRIMLSNDAPLTNWLATFTSSTEFTLSNTVNGGVASGNIADETKGTVFDVTGQLMDTPEDMIADETTLYIADYITGLVVVDITDKDNPGIIKIFKTGSIDNLKGITKFGEHLFLTNYDDDTLIIVNIAERSNPSIVASLADATNLNGPVGIGYKNGYIYVACDIGNSITVIDVTDVNNPAYSNKLTGTGSPNYMDGINSLSIKDSVLYFITSSDGRIGSVDITTPTAIIVLDTVGTPGALLSGGNDLAVDGDFAYTTASSGIHHSFAMFNISDPSSITFVDGVDSDEPPDNLGGANSVAVLENYAYIATLDEVFGVKRHIGNETVGNTSDSIGSANPYKVYTFGSYLYIAYKQNSIGVRIFKIMVSDSDDNNNRTIGIQAGAFFSTISTGDTAAFVTAVNYDNLNVIQALYNLLTLKAGLSNAKLDCSSFFGDKTLGKLRSSASIGDTTIRVNAVYPQLIKSGETLEISEGVTSEEVDLTGDISDTFPPYVDIDVDALTNDYTIAASVVWKQRTETDDSYSFDLEYRHCDNYGYTIAISFERDIDISQAIEEITKHFDGYLFADNWGREKVHSFRPKYFSSPLELDQDTTIIKPDPTLGHLELVNKFKIHYGYDYYNSKFVYEYIYPESDDDNYSINRNEFTREIILKLPGLYDHEVAKCIARHKYAMWKDGLRLVEITTSIRDILQVQGDRLAISTENPAINSEMEIYGVAALRLLTDYSITFYAYLADKIWKDWIFAGIYKAGSGDRIW